MNSYEYNEAGWLIRQTGDTNLDGKLGDNSGLDSGAARDQFIEYDYYQKSVFRTSKDSASLSAGVAIGLTCF